MYEDHHPLADLRRELVEIAARKDAAALAELLRGERLPALGGHAEPAELIHGALMLAPDGDLTKAVGALVGDLLEQRAVRFQEGSAAGGYYPEDAGYVANCLRISELLPRQQELFAGVRRFFNEGISLAALKEDHEGLGRRLREALRWQQTSADFEGYWLGLIRNADHRTDLLDGWNGILWLERPATEPKFFERIDTALQAFAEASAKQVQHTALLGWAVRTLDEAYPSSAQYWQEGLGKAAGTWPPELLLVFQQRWSSFAAIAPKAKSEGRYRETEPHFPLDIAARNRIEAESQARIVINRWAAGFAAAAWIPGSNFAMTAGDPAMVVQVGSIFGVNVDRTQAGAVFASVAGPLMASKVAHSILDFIPVLGWAVKSVVAATVIKGVGEALISYFKDRSPLPG